MSTAATTAIPNPREPLFRVHDLAVSFDSANGPRVRAVDGARMSIYPGQTLAVVGESGCGKSVTAMSALQLIPTPPGRIDGGSVTFQSKSGEVDLLKLDASAIRRIRGNEVAMIFQEPMTSLNPVFTIGDQILESIILHQRVSKAAAREIAIKAMTDVGIPDPARRIGQYPHQFSGGMRQRVMIAMALACKPRLLLADEPTTALDVTVQAQILELLREFQTSTGLAIMLITHAMGVVAQSADTVCVMYAGRIVEYASVLDLFDNPLHPYTRGLLASIPRVGQRKDRLTTIKQVVDDPSEFKRLPVIPWWPLHDPPRDVRPNGPDYHLVEVAPNHWVGAWRTTEATPRPPDLAYRRPR